MILGYFDYIGCFVYILEILGGLKENFDYFSCFILSEWVFWFLNVFGTRGYLGKFDLFIIIFFLERGVIGYFLSHSSDLGDFRLFRGLFVDLKCVFRGIRIFWSFRRFRKLL